MGFLFSSTGCVYFNTYYNAEKSYRLALKMRAKRLDKNPSDSVLATAEEKLKFERCVTKCSKVLELYPKEKEWQGKAVFLMAEAYYQQGEWTRAIGKYDEFLQYFPSDPKGVAAEVHRGIALYHNGQYPAAHSALERMLAQALSPELRTEALLCLAKLEGVGGSREATLAAYERLLKEAAKSPMARAQAHAAAAVLAYDLRIWEKARAHARAPETVLLSVGQRIRLAVLAADALYQQGQYSQGLAELESALSVKALRDSLSPLHLKLAEGHLALRQHGKAFDLIAKVTRAVPLTALSAEAWYRRGEHELRVFLDEPAAKSSFDSSAAQGMDFTYGKLARDRSEALAQLAQYRKPGKTAITDSASPWRDEFMIAELFLFKLDQIDSAMARLDRIAASPLRDSVFTMRAAYARAYIEEEYRKDKTRADSLYREIIGRYPGTEFAKQAESNLGIKATVQTTEDSAHALFLEAEKLRFGGGDVTAQVLPAYARVRQAHPQSAMAAKAQFAVAMLYEGAEGLGTGRIDLDSAKVAYVLIRDQYPRSPYAPLAQAKLLQAGVTGRAIPPSAQVPGDTARIPGAGNSAPHPSPSSSASSSSPAATPPIIPHKGQKLSGQELSPDRDHSRSRPLPEEHGASPAQADTSGSPEGKTKEVLEPDYDDVDQY